MVEIPATRFSWTRTRCTGTTTATTSSAECTYAEKTSTIIKDSCNGTTDGPDKIISQCNGSGTNNQATSWCWPTRSSTTTTTTVPRTLPWSCGIRDGGIWGLPQTRTLEKALAISLPAVQEVQQYTAVRSHFIDAGRLNAETVRGMWNAFDVVDNPLRFQKRDPCYAPSKWCHWK